LSLIPHQSLCPAAIPSAASKVYVIPVDWAANELLIKRETLSKGV